MSRLRPHAQTAIGAEAIETWLRARWGIRAALVEVRELGQTTQADLKSYGYGRPLHVRYQLDGAMHDLVLRTMTPDPFGHDRRSDRVASMVGDCDTFAGFPRHIQPIEAGTFGEDGGLVAFEDGDAWLATEYVEGELYAEDLRALATSADDALRVAGLARARALASYLVEVHAVPAPAAAWQRCLRDTVGSGEGIFGLCESYPRGENASPVVPSARLIALEQAAVAARWDLAARYDAAARARRTHGDFHPFNILFREGTDFSVLDASRGAAGEPADDVTCLSINYLFFALRHGDAAFEGPLRALWDAFWSRYLGASGDRAVLGLVAPFFAWRALVVASPVWYPDVPDALRDRLLGFAEALLGGAEFDPSRVEVLLG